MFSDPPDLFLEGHVLESGDWESEKQGDSAFEDDVGIVKGTGDLLRRAFDGGRIGDAPVGGCGVSGPVGTDFVCGVVADGDDEVELRRSGLGEFVSRLAARTFDRDADGFELCQRFRPNCARGVAARAVGHEAAVALMVEDRLREDGARGVSGAKEENVIGLGH